MRDLTKGKFFRPGMVKALKEKYFGCAACKVDLQSQSNTSLLVVPENLQLPAPGEQIFVDFALYNNHNLVVIKVSVSGFLWAKHTRDETIEVAFKVIVEWSHRFGLPHQVCSDGKGCFRSRFIEKLKQMGMTHTYTSLYHSESNGGVG